MSLFCTRVRYTRQVTCCLLCSMDGYMAWVLMAFVTVFHFYLTLSMYSINIAEILLKVVLNTINQIIKSIKIQDFNH